MSKSRQGLSSSLACSTMIAANRELATGTSNQDYTRASYSYHELFPSRYDSIASLSNHTYFCLAARKGVTESQANKNFREKRKEKKRKEKKRAFLNGQNVNTKVLIAFGG
jgi:hypothetical protein